MHYATMIKSGTFAQAPEDIRQSVDYPDNLSQHPFEEFLEFMRPTFQKEDELRAEESRTFWNLIIHAGDEQRDRCSQKVERARYDSMRELVV